MHFASPPGEKCGLADVQPKAPCHIFDDLLDRNALLHKHRFARQGIQASAGRGCGAHRQV